MESSVSSDLLERVRDALEELAPGGDAPPGQGRAQTCTALVRGTREALAQLRETQGEASPSPGKLTAARAIVHRILDAAARRPLRLAMHDSPFRHEWTNLLLDAVNASDYGVGALFFGRARALGDRTLFLLPYGSPRDRIPWSEAEDRVVAIGRALLAHEKKSPVAPVAMLSQNSPDLALFDLACLVTGTVNVPVPANSTPAQIAAILKHVGARSLFLGDDELADTALSAIPRDARPEHVVRIDPTRPETAEIRAFADFLDAGRAMPRESVREAAFAVRSGDLATLMVTSGSTGEPKSVRFTQGNLVTKRYARAAAWPHIGEGDVFLCYLPLFHTFGRWLEMLGCVFWGAMYAFVEDTSLETLLHAFHRVRPTTFISVPKRWIQIAEAAGPLSEHDVPDEERIGASVKELTGGRLRRGLSAAGYLPPAVFHRFHRAGIELHSGFGMTEATGGITMTPAGDYRNDSIGVALPGIELRVADDGELWVRGPYVTAPPPGEPPLVDGWFPTGDIVRTDADGHLVIVDRKKEIFKNVQGETISPRRIEQLFSEYDVVERVLVIGDRREYCTALIVPSKEIRDAHARSGATTIESPEVRDLFTPIVATVNRFLAPYERILDFAILARDLDESELTAKGTARRNLVAERTREVIEPMYSREQVAVTLGGESGVVVRLPHWFFRQVGVPSSELHAADGETALALGVKRLSITRDAADRIRVGDLDYDPGGKELLLGEIFGRPELWLPNPAAREFAGRGIEHWWRRGRRFRVRTRMARGPQTIPAERLELAFAARPTAASDLLRLHAAASRLHHPDRSERLAAIESVRSEIGRPRSELEPIARELLLTALEDTALRPHALRALLPALAPQELVRLLETELADDSFLDGPERKVVGDEVLRSDQLEAIAVRLESDDPPLDDGARERLLRFLVIQAVHHPAHHRRVRTLLVDLGENASSTETRRALDELVGELVRDFRAALPQPLLSPGLEWKDVISFGRAIPAEHAKRIASALTETALLAEARALLGPGALPASMTLGRASVRVDPLARGRGRTVYRVAVEPESAEGHDAGHEFVLKVRDDQSWEEVQDELRLLVIAREGWPGRPVVKSIGGGYRGPGAWTEEYLPGRTLEHVVEQLRREPRSTSEEDTSDAGRLPEVWPFLIVTCASLLVEFWKRTNRRVAIDRPTATSLVLPAHDWQVGGRLVSISGRMRCRRLTQVLESVQRGIVGPIQERVPAVGTAPEWKLLFSAVLETFGEEEGLAMLEEEMRDDLTKLALEESSEADEREMPGSFHRFASQVRRHGFLPVRIRIAARRYRRWSHLNPKATLEAQATTLDEIEDAYGLEEMEAERPGSRLQLYRHTVFRGVDPAFGVRIDDLSARILRERPPRDEWSREVGGLRESFALGELEEFFLARVLYPHLDPGERAALVREEDRGGGSTTGLRVDRKDAEGRVFRVRRPANPNEISALDRIFRVEDFRRMSSREAIDHLVATDEADRIIGGLVFRRVSESYVRLEWIVVGNLHRGRGIGGELLDDFLERMRAEGVRAVSTGFFRPVFFSKFGFGVDPRYPGLVKILEPVAERPPTSSVEDAAGR